MDLSRLEEIASDHVGSGEPLGVPLGTQLPLERAEAASALGQIGHALVAAHAVGVGHGALSLDRVFVTTENDELFVRLFGFGVAIETYRHVHDDVVGLAAIATEPRRRRRLALGRGTQRAQARVRRAR